MAAAVKVAMQKRADSANAAAHSAAAAARQADDATEDAQTTVYDVKSFLSSGNEVDPLPPEVDAGFWKFQRRAAEFYLEAKVQWFVAGLIGFNFMMNVLEKWIDPRGLKYPSVFFGFEIFFNTIFLGELFVNMYGFWLCRFWRSAWNVFDFVVVFTSILTMFYELPPPLNMLRMMRAFRVFRLFKRVKSLNKIITSLAKAVPGVTNAFGILTIIVCIFAILGVDRLMEFGLDGTLENEYGQEFNYTTSRGKFYGDEYFGNFGKSFYTMFQVMTGESWSEAVARPIVHSQQPDQAIGASLFFVIFQLVTSIVLLNVVVAVLLEKMVDDEEETLIEEVQDAIVASAEKKASVMIAQDKERRSMALQNSFSSDAAKSDDSWRSPTNGDATEESLSLMEADLQDLKTDMVLIKEKMARLVATLLPEASDHLQ